MTEYAILTVLLGALLFQSFCVAKLALSPHDMRMEDFEIRRKEWNKKETKYSLKFSSNGEVINTSGNLQRYLKRYQIYFAFSHRFILSCVQENRR